MTRQECEQAYCDGAMALSLLLFGDPAKVDRAKAGNVVQFALLNLALVVRVDLQTLEEAKTAIDQAKAAEKMWREMAAKPLPCGHAVGDLIGGGCAITKCGACQREHSEAKRAPGAPTAWEAAIVAELDAMAEVPRG